MPPAADLCGRLAGSRRTRGHGARRAPSSATREVSTSDRRSDPAVTAAVTHMAAEGVAPIPARPSPFELDPGSCALIIVDMQNDFASPTGMFDRLGIPLPIVRSVIEPTRQVLVAARSAGMLVMYLAMQFAEDLSNMGRPSAPNRVRHLAAGVGQPTATPDGSTGRVLISNTWNGQVLDELAPRPGDRARRRRRPAQRIRLSPRHLSASRVPRRITRPRRTSRPADHALCGAMRDECAGKAHCSAHAYVGATRFLRARHPETAATDSASPVRVPTTSANADPP